MTAIGHQSPISVAASAPQATPAPTRSRARLRIGLFLKYVVLFFAVVLVALITNGAFEVWFSYQEYKSSLIRIQREQAEAAAAKIGQFIREIEAQVGWTTQLPWSAGTLEQRRFDGVRLLRQVPAITDTQLDATGHGDCGYRGRHGRARERSTTQKTRSSPRRSPTRSTTARCIFDASRNLT
jgi:cytochrome bd-type quinol oxidase subunit 1